MVAKNALLFLVAIVILQNTNASEPESSNYFIKTDEQIEKSVFNCREAGIYPDLEDCLKYHFCSANPLSIAQSSIERVFDDISETCENGYGYDPKTSRCTLPLDNGVCPEVVPKCQTAFQLGPIVRNPILYYVCIPSSTGALVAEIFACPVNMIHDGVTCVSNIPESGIDDNGLCIKAGSFYHPDDCMKTLYCSEQGVPPVEKKCSACYKFNWQHEMCEQFTCNNQNM